MEREEILPDLLAIIYTFNYSFCFILDSQSYSEILWEQWHVRKWKEAIISFAKNNVLWNLSSKTDADLRYSFIKVNLDDLVSA